MLLIAPVTGVLPTARSDAFAGGIENHVLTPLPQEQFERFATALAEMQAITLAYEELVETAAPDQADTLLARARAAVDEAVRKQGFLMREFDELVERALQDKGIRDALRARLNPEMYAGE